MSLFSRCLRAYSFLVLGFLAVLGTGGCGDDAISTAQVRFIQASPDAPEGLVFTWHGNVVLTNLSYQEDSGYFVPPKPQMEITIKNAFTSDTITTFNAEFEDGTDYTIVLVNPVDQIEALILTDDLSPPFEGEFKFRFLNMSPSAGNVDVYIIPPGFTLENTIALAQDIKYKGGTLYFTPDAGTYRVVVTETGTTTVLKETAELNFNAGTIRSALLLDDAGGGALFSLKILADSN